jgi:hypothetical protein
MLVLDAGLNSAVTSAYPKPSYLGMFLLDSIARYQTHLQPKLATRSTTKNRFYHAGKRHFEFIAKRFSSGNAKDSPTPQPYSFPAIDQINPQTCQSWPPRRPLSAPSLQMMFQHPSLQCTVSILSISSLAPYLNSSLPRSRLAPAPHHPRSSLRLTIFSPRRSAQPIYPYARQWTPSSPFPSSHSSSFRQ